MADNKGRGWGGRSRREKEDGATRKRASRARRVEKVREVMRRERGIGVRQGTEHRGFTVRVETARENGQECNGGLHKSAGRTRAFMEIGRRPSQAEAGQGLP